MYIYIYICYPPLCYLPFRGFPGRASEDFRGFCIGDQHTLEQVEGEDAKFELAACPLCGLDPFRLATMLSMYWVRRWPVLARMSLPAAKTHAAFPLRGLGLLVP